MSACVLRSDKDFKIHSSLAEFGFKICVPKGLCQVWTDDLLHYSSEEMKHASTTPIYPRRRPGSPIPPSTRVDCSMPRCNELLKLVGFLTVTCCERARSSPEHTGRRATLTFACEREIHSGIPFHRSGVRTRSWASGQ